MEKWEYQSIKLAATGWFPGGEVDEGELDSNMNALGRDGWELVSAFDTNTAQGQSLDVIVIFKRKLIG